jgi:uncharacterized protein (DUF608 family)
MMAKHTRREMLKLTGTVGASALVGRWLQAATPGKEGPEDSLRLFPAGLGAAQWSTFRAAGYSAPVTGIIYRGDPRPQSGMPLGALDTNCIDLETAGTFGYSSLFNHFTPRGGPLNTPFLGISVGGKTWVLTTGETKVYDGGREPIPALGRDLVLPGVEKARAIDYWGHYPIADLEYDTDAPVAVGLRAWSPFLPGDSATSNTPAAVFEVHLRNPSGTRQSGAIAFSFPGFESHKTRRFIEGPVFSGGMPPLAANPPARSIVRKVIPKGPAGVWVGDVNWQMSYVLGVIGEEKIRTGGELNTDNYPDGTKWSNIEKKLPEVKPESGGTTVAVDFDLKPGEKKVVRYVLAWYAPEWKSTGSPEAGDTQNSVADAVEHPENLLTTREVGLHFYTHMYAARYPDALMVARLIVREHESLLKRIIAWQEVIYAAPEVPGWLADSLINILYMIPENSMWAQAKPPIGEWCRPEDGLFVLSESPRSCPSVDTLPNAACGDLVLAYFFPDCELASLRTYKAYQETTTGSPPVLLGWRGELAAPIRGWQNVLNGSNYMVLVDRYWKVTGDNAFLKEFYDSAKRATEYAFNQRPEYGLSQIVAMPTPGIDVLSLAYDTEWFEDRPYYGYVSHSGGIRIAHGRMMRRWAEKMNDPDYVRRMDAYLNAGAEAVERYLWNGTYYIDYNEPETGRRLDRIFTPQLDGQYFVLATGLAGVFPKRNVDSILKIIREKACTVSKLGMPPNYVAANGGLWMEPGGYLTGQYTYENFPIYFMAMTYMYEGQKEFGLELLRKNLEIYACRNAYSWDGVNVASGNGDDGKRSYGYEYGQNMGLWGVIAALQGQDVAEPVKPQGLVTRIIQAARKN